MTTYVKVEDGQIVTQANDKESLPESYIWPDGRATSGFNKLTEEELSEAGWIPVLVDKAPKYSADTQRLINERIVLIKGAAVRIWDVEDIPAVVQEAPVEPEPSLQDRVEALETKIATLVGDSAAPA